MNNITIVEVPSEVGCAQQGASLGPAAIRIVANQNGSDFFSKYPVITVPDRNSIFSKTDKRSVCDRAKRAQYVVENCQLTCNTIDDVLRSGCFPVILSADHSSGLGVIAGIRQSYPNDRLGVIWIDAHSDMHSPYTTHSGNFHGMPLGAALGLNERARLLVNREPNELPSSTQRQWEYLKTLGGKVPNILPEDLILIGVRFFKPEHSAIIEDLQVPLYCVEDVRTAGVGSVSDSIEERLKNCDKILISFDVDSLDCDVVSCGTGTPEPNGLYLNEAKELVQRLMTSSKIVALEIAEVNPLLDNKGNAMAEAAWEIMSSAFGDKL